MNNQDFGKLLLRLSLGGMMLLHGVSKIQHGIGGIMNMLAEKGIPQFVGYGVYIGEVLAPILLIFGFRTKLAALVFAINMVIAVGLAHPDDLNQFTRSGAWAVELQALYFFGSLALVFLGGGRLAFSHKNRWD